jgi:hypothetical protein
MSLISRLAVVAAVATIGIAGPAFAQSFDPDVGTGNIVPFSVGPGSVQSTVLPMRVAARTVRHGSGAARRSGLNAFAMVPAAGGGSAFSPAATGGGSVGYNENLRADTW